MAKTIQWRGFLAAMMLMLISVAVPLVVAEMACRVYLFRGISTPTLRDLHLLQEFHPERGWRGRPNQSVLSQRLDFVVTTRTNSRGYNDREHTYAKPPGVFRVVVLGDSFMNAREVRREDSLPVRLEAKLADRDVEVINLGIVGYGPVQEYLTLRDEGLRYDPDLVVVAMYLNNDLRDGSRPLNALLFGEDAMVTVARPYLRPGKPGDPLDIAFPDPEEGRLRMEEVHRKAEEEKDHASWVSRTALGILGEQAWSNLRQQVGKPAFSPMQVFGPYLTQPEQNPYLAEWERAWTDVERGISAIDALTREHGARLALFFIPCRLQVDRKYRERVTAENEYDLDLYGPEQRMAQWAQEQGIPALDLTKCLGEADAAGEAPTYYQIQNMHWNPRGHGVATESSSSFWTGKRLLP